jgi:hypothetical protein
MLELEAGKVRHESDYWDAATFMKRVGLLTEQDRPVGAPAQNR